MKPSLVQDIVSESVRHFYRNSLPAFLWTHINYLVPAILIEARRLHSPTNID
jgi:hypothetical protein